MRVAIAMPIELRGKMDRKRFLYEMVVMSKAVSGLEVMVKTLPGVTPSGYLYREKPTTLLFLPRRATAQLRHKQ